MPDYSPLLLESPNSRRSTGPTNMCTVSDPDGELQPYGNADAALGLSLGLYGLLDGGGEGSDLAQGEPEVDEGQARLEALGGCGYEVQPGNTLWDIAAANTGEGQEWRKLYEDNKQVVGDNPNLILPGQILDLCGDTPETTEEAAPLVKAAEEQPPATFVDVATGMFPTLAGEDGYLSSDELDAAMSRPDLTVEQSAALVTLRQLRADLEELNNDELLDEDDGVTLADLEIYRQTGDLPGVKSTPDEWYAHYQEKMGNLSQKSFKDTPPDVNAIHQGAIGDCYFLAALGNAVEQNPQAVKEMVVPEPDGTYTVTFPNGQSTNVTAPTLAEMATYGNSGQDGMWVTLFERAAGNIRDEDADPPEEALGWGSVAGRAGTDLFSGDGSSNVDMLSLTETDTTRERMESAMSEGRVVIAGIANDPLSDNREGLPDAHAYSVLGYDPQTDTVTLRNPHGHGERRGPDGPTVDGVDDGVFTLTMDEFNALFSTVSYANAPLTKAE